MSRARPGHAARAWAVVAAVAAVVPGAARARADVVEPAAEDAVQAPSPEHGAEVDRLRRELRVREAQLGKGRRRLLFAELGEPDRKEPGRIVRVANPQSWPDDTVTSYSLVVDERRHVRLLQQSPVSFSGDWSLELTHVFDERGRTVAFERRSGFLNSGCSEVANERSVAFFDGRGHRLAREWRLENGDGRPLSPRGCAFPYRHEYRILPDVRSALSRARLLAPAQRAGAAVPGAARRM